MNAYTQKAKPDDRSQGHTFEDQPSHPLDDVLAPAPDGDAILQLRTGLFELGRNRARLSGATEPVPEDLRTLEDHARAMARDTYRDLFDPGQNLHDRMHQAEYERLLKQREETEKGVAYATANLRDAELRLAKTAKAGAKPLANDWLVAAFIVAITITVAPTLHDFLFFSISDDLLSWFGASISAAFIASMLTLAILSGRRTTWTWIGVVAGIMLGLGLGALRLSSAEGWAEVMFAVGLTIVEVSAVLLLEWLASGLRNSEDQWNVVRAAEDEAIGSREAAQADLLRWQARLRELNEEIRNKIAYVEDRFNRNLHLPELEAVAIKAVSDGYNAGITENLGHLRGATRRT
jgi:hypothetical protein